MEKGKLVSSERQLATVMTKFFINITKNLERRKKIEIMQKMCWKFSIHTEVLKELEEILKLMKTFFSTRSRSFGAKSKFETRRLQS